MDKKRIVMAGGTLACIGAIGFFMQGGGLGSKPKAPMAQPVQMSANPGVNGMQTPVDISEISLTSADVEVLQPPQMPTAGTPVKQALPQIETPATDAPVSAALAAEQPVAAAKPETSEIEQPVAISLLDPKPAATMPKPSMREAPTLSEGCEIKMNGSEIAGALVKLDLTAPCLPNERVTLHHNGMMFTETTDAGGKLDLVVPALAENAIFIASFPNSEGAVANVKVTSLDLFDRAVVQSEFMSAVGLHALEYGAGYEDRGHVWANATGEIADAALGKGGFMILLGNPAVSEGTMAQVYTFPSAMAEESGNVELSVEIEVTNSNCGLEIEAQALQVKAGAQPKVQTLDLTMPDCDAVGDFLVLKNLVDDLKVAAVN